MNRALMLLLALLTSWLVGCASEPIESPRAGERYAIIETSASRKADGIFPVLITAIDDRRYNTAPDDLRRAEAGFPYGRTHFTVAPGTHRIKALAVVDRRYVPGVSRDVSYGGDDVLEENFQSGVRYFVGLKADSPRRADWQLVIWKKEEIEAGTLDLGD
ncbi:MAG: hypothetical protein R3200_05800 [Xanthomonadales bacterium]|nr:hypothetical protein [Xanthomonadales bacterium]